jgi:peptidyl-dipeptidase Dcp
MLSKLILGLLCERKIPVDRRAVLTPTQCASLLQNGVVERILVEPSAVRLFDDSEYAAVGCEVTSELSDAAYLLGVKEVKLDYLRPGQRHFFFSHTFKFQPYNRGLLRACLNKNVELIDWERITQPNGQRVIGFGRFAGLVGAYEALRGWGLAQESWNLPDPRSLHGLADLLLHLPQLPYPTNFKVAVTGRGRVGEGAVEVLHAAGFLERTPEEFLAHEGAERVYAVFASQDYAERADGGGFDRTEFHQHPERYRSTFGRVLQAADLYLPCHYYAEGGPAFFTAEEALGARTKFVGDISCDIAGPIPCTLRPSTLDEPFYGWDPGSGHEVPLGTPGSIGVLAVDNLPTALPRDASESFGEQFIEHVLPALLNADADGRLERATECRNGALTPHYSYLQGYVTALDFPQRDPESWEKEIRLEIDRARTAVESLANAPEPATFNNTVAALERSSYALDALTEELFNANSACTTPEIQALTQRLTPALSALSNDIGLNPQLFARIRAVHDAPDRALHAEEQRLLELTYKRFVRNGALLDASGQEQLRALDEALGLASLRFGEKNLADLEGFAYHCTAPEEVSGIPAEALAAAEQAARAAGKESGWLFTLHAPSYLAYLTYCDYRHGREHLWRAFGQRGYRGDTNDTRAVVAELVRLRSQRAQLLGYATHADFVLEERMAKSPEAVHEFLLDLTQKAKPVAEREAVELREFAAQHLHLTELRRWDVGYASEKMKKMRFDVDDEALKPYFPLHRVLDGAFAVATRLYGLRFVEASGQPTYHPDAQMFEVWRADGRFCAHLLADFHPRPGKRQGAWMTSYRSQSTDAQGHETRPVISMVCNFTPPSANGTPALLTFNEVLTLFHEFGHALHGMLAEGTFASLTGTNVRWDFVELPSQIMENWCTEPEALALFAQHYRTGEPLHASEVAKLRAAANFQEGLATLRQLGFGLLDLAWHHADWSRTEATDVEGVEAAALAPVEWMPREPNTSLSTAFSHLFSGGYSAGYYSYKWAEVLDADAFARFEEEGIFSPQVGADFAALLSAGGTVEPGILFEQFRGRAPRVEPLLKRAGLL